VPEITYSEREYQKHKKEIQNKGKDFNLYRTNYRNELSYISRVLLTQKYGRKHMNLFLKDFSFYWHESVDYVYSLLKGDKNHLSLYYAVIIAIGILDDYYDALLLIEAAGFPFNNLEYNILKEFLGKVYSIDNLNKMSIRERVSLKETLLCKQKQKELNALF